jgi:hypothetical protein
LAYCCCRPLLPPRLPRAAALSSRVPTVWRCFCLQGGDIRELDFRFFLGDTKIGAPFHGLRAFFTTPQVWPRVVVLLRCGCHEVAAPPGLLL